MSYALHMRTLREGFYCDGSNIHHLLGATEALGDCEMSVRQRTEAYELAQSYQLTLNSMAETSTGGTHWCGVSADEFGQAAQTISLNGSEDDYDEDEEERLVELRERCAAE